MKPQYTLRPATESDREWLRWLHHATLREAVEAIWGWDEAVQDELFDRRSGFANRRIVQVDGQDAGVIGVTHRGDRLFLDDIEIAPEYQGHGLGTALIRDLHAQAGAEGIPLCLQVLVTNRARALYQRLGFSITGESDTRYHMCWFPESAARR
jgi:ribosomal protein S18 acetylase RimI-like enzyme